jgi:hypothetical protein
LRPPVAEDRLSLAPDGSVLVRLKTPWRDGTSHIALEPLELLEKLAALIPRPYVNPIVYHGVLAPNAKWRREVVDFGRPRLERPSSATTPKKLAAPHNRTWAELMRRGLDIDVLECPDCGARLRFVAAILLSSAIRRILRHLGLPSDPVELAPARAPPHTTTAWTPAVGGNHPESAFPILSGPHSKYQNDCVSCHNPDLGSSVDGENADCVGCHDGNHTRAKMDPKHDEEPDYPQGAAPPNFCLDCHPAGRKEED